MTDKAFAKFYLCVNLDDPFTPKIVIQSVLCEDLKDENIQNFMEYLRISILDLYEEWRDDHPETRRQLLDYYTLGRTVVDK